MRERKFHKKIPLASWLLILVALGSLGTGTVAAYLSYATKPVTNTFQAAQSVVPSVQETFNDKVKTNVSINVGNTSVNNDAGYSVYVRAAVIVTWKDSAGDVLGKVPVEGTDYEISFNKNDWFLEGDYWYHREAVNSQRNTGNLITRCKMKEGAVVPEGYTLNVEILAQTIQALGTTDEGDTPVVPAVTDAWGVTVNNDGTLAPPTT